MPTQITYNQLLIIGAIFGIVLGLVPLILGFKKQNIKMGIIGFISAVAVGIPFSFLGALPVAIIFTWLILRKPAETAPVNTEIVDENSADMTVIESEKPADDQIPNA
jgi:hypothetical protein